MVASHYEAALHTMYWVHLFREVPTSCLHFQVGFCPESKRTPFILDSSVRNTIYEPFTNLINLVTNYLMFLKAFSAIENVLFKDIK